MYEKNVVGNVSVLEEDFFFSTKHIYILFWNILHVVKSWIE